MDLLKMCSSNQQGICNIQRIISEVQKLKKVMLIFQIKNKKNLVGPLPHTQFPWAPVTRRCLLSAAARTPFVSLPICGSVTVTVGINADSCPSGCNQCGSSFDNIIGRTLTYSMLTFSLRKSFATFAVTRVSLIGFGFRWLLVQSWLWS